MLGMPEPTPYDLRFRFLGIPVRVHPSFWLVAALLGSVDDRGFNPQSILLRVACIFVSILVHEYGHGLMSRIFRRSPAIALYGMGGVCYSEAERQSPWQRLAVLIAGPGAGFLLYHAFRIVKHLFSLGVLSNPLGWEVVVIMLWINWYWSLLNLFPIWPLDGGQIAGVVLPMVNRRKGMGWAHVVSLLTAGIVAMLAFQQEDLFRGIFFAYFAVINFQVLQSLHHAAKFGSVEDDADWWRR